MQISLLPLLAIVSAVAAMDRNCRQYDILFVKCLQKKEADSLIMPQIGQGTWGNLGKDVYKFENHKMACFGGDGADYISNNVPVANNVGPVGHTCPAGYSKYQSELRIWRWRNMWSYCSDASLNDQMVASIETLSSSTKFWKATAVGKQVRCKGS